VIHLQTLATGDFEFMGVKTETIKNGCMDVGDVVAIGDGVKP
jgi:hypothetical protein